ncbi:hypothetical protein AJ80_04344 [Polytolypa hystricis UAMH7299]|uniref:Xylanolytic transcriptional activator regulatory domain-containing protein n=1 Tax=Polytolypa hystricis (strain UAMH7299) TaxID=1447883 RepID=A0A2B7YCA3_POLH7|nr:hypothetical protein AJ80_04344 [Polytolypa hystricis UAMH7299]
MSSYRTRERELRACKLCANAKVKCEIEYGAPKCKRQSKEILLLESKVNSIAHLLSSSAPSAAGNISPNVPQYVSEPVPAHTARYGHLPALHIENKAILPDTQEAVTLLGIFCRDMAPLFPFVVAPSNVTPGQLAQEKPVLYMAIMVVTCQSDTQRQLSLAKAFREEASRMILVSGEKNLGILQGLLVYLAWNQVHLQLSQQFAAFLHLAYVMMVDLGLHKEPHISPHAAGLLRDLNRANASVSMRTLEERRVLLGVFWLSSIMSTCSKEMSGIRFTRYVNQCWQVLQESLEYPTDMYLVQLVRLQQFADTIGKSLYHDNPETPPVMPATVPMCISWLEKEVQRVGDTLQLDIPQASLLMISYHTVQIYLYKIALDDSLFPSSWTSNNTYPIVATDTLRHTDLLVRCLTAIKSLTDHFFSITDHLIPSLPYPTWGQLGHSIMILRRLIAFKHEAWDTSYISGTLNFRDLLNTLARRLEGVMRLGLQSNPIRQMPEIFGKLVERLDEIARNTGETMASTSAGAVNAGDGAGGNGMVPDASLDDIGMLFDEETAQAMFQFFDLGMGM